LDASCIQVFSSKVVAAPILDDTFGAVLEDAKGRSQADRSFPLPLGESLRVIDFPAIRGRHRVGQRQAFFPGSGGGAGSVFARLSAEIAMRRLLLVCIIGVFSLGGTVLAAGERFIQSAWLCVSPEAHAEAVAASAGQDGAAFEDLKARLLAEKKCTYLPEQDFNKVITAVRIMETGGDLVRVMFTLQVGDQMPAEVRREGFYGMLVWTARANLKRQTEGDLI
jgi:hypothetical protein